MVRFSAMTSLFCQKLTMSFILLSSYSNHYIHSSYLPMASELIYFTNQISRILDFFARSIGGALVTREIFILRFFSIWASTKFSCPENFQFSLTANFVLSFYSLFTYFSTPPPPPPTRCNNYSISMKVLLQVRQNLSSEGR